MRSIRPTVLAVVCVVMLAVTGASATPAFAEGVAPWWGLTSAARPTDLPPGGKGQIVVLAQNLGDAAASGATTAVRVVDKLPAGLTATSIEGVAGRDVNAGSRGPVSCVLATLTCTFSSSLPAFEAIEVRIAVKVKTAVSGELNSATVSGGGAATANVSHPIEVGEGERFGIEQYELLPEEPGGSIDTQAGSHPFQLTSSFILNSQTPDSEGQARAVALPRSLVAQLPTGVFGNPTPFAQCTEAQFADSYEKREGNVEAFVNECPASTAIGVASVTINTPGFGVQTVLSPIFNMKPLNGQPARFAFKVAGIFPVFLDASVRTGGDYGVTVGSRDITQVAWTLGVRLTFWGVPGDLRHNSQRGWSCLVGMPGCNPPTNPSPPPFLVMPTSCAAPFVSTLRGESWGSSERPIEQAEPVSYQLPEAIDGCNHLPFLPSLNITPDVNDGSSPTGLNVDVHVPQEAALNPEGLAESTLKDTTVLLPSGVTLNPAGADGLEACTESEIGFTGIEPEGLQRDLFTPGLPEPFCPDASKVGTVKIKTPLLANALEGAVYIATQEQNPSGSLIGMYLVAQDPVSGTVIKVAGEVKPDPVTGQLLTTFKNTPELPFEDLELHFFGGERAPLSTPAHCGVYTTDATFTPWSGNEPASPSGSFDITSGPNGAPCPGASLPFSPSLTAGSTSIQAGGFSPFTMTMSREDGQQSLQAISLHMPPGLSGTLSGVELCPEAQANEGLCGPKSQIGETVVSVGLGNDPFSVKGGRVYLTGPYKGAPFGLSIVNPAKAGPFDLENHTACDCVLVRAKIEVDPITSQLTITSDNEGPYKIPTILQGIPLQIKHVNVTINRPGFTFNPTNCTPMSITGSLSSAEGAASSLSVPLQVTNCATLGFKPKFAVATSGKTSRVNGASLDAKLAYPSGAMGTQANIRSVKVKLPKQLPSRLSTLQKACTDKVFDVNPAACPAASRVGTATTTTPIIPVPLSGPVYFVSHAAEKFPELIIVLSGYGVTVDLHGETYISKAGITSTTFNTVPDVPVGSFELNLPEGPYSALAANGNLCKQKLLMPTRLVGQNGDVITQSTKIAVGGCPKVKVAKKKSSKHNKKK